MSCLQKIRCIIQSDKGQDDPSWALAEIDRLQLLDGDITPVTTRPIARRPPGPPFDVVACDCPEENCQAWHVVSTGTEQIMCVAQTYEVAFQILCALRNS